MSTTGFTDIAIRNLKAGDTRREIPDPGCSGLYVIVQPSGKKSFAVRYRANGTPRKLTLRTPIRPRHYQGNPAPGDQGRAG
jgi:hypothetical protein